jgi:hypothetical protein
MISAGWRMRYVGMSQDDTDGGALSTPSDGIVRAMHTRDLGAIHDA